VLGVAAAVLLLAVGAALIATLVIDPDRYKREIERTVRRETGRPFVLEGHLRLAWFPWLGVRTGAARLGNPHGAGGPDLLDWQSARVRVRLLPLLLHRRLEVGRIRIVGADIHLRRGPQGQGSWDDLLARLETGSRTSTTPDATSNGARASTADAVMLAGLDLEQSSLDYVDERSREHLTLTGWQLSLGPWSAGEPLSVSTRFTLHVDTPAPGVSASVAIPQLEVRTSPLEVSSPRWSVGIADAKLQGAADARRSAAGELTASGSLTAAVPSLRRLGSALGIGLPVVADPAALGALSLSANWRYESNALEVKPLAARLDSTTLTGWVAYSGAWTFALQADQIDFGRYVTQSKAHQPLELPVSALRALHAQGTLEVGRAQIDGTTLADVRLQVQ
jgi:AsmA protein